MKLIMSYKEVSRHSRKATESERMKTAFIESMCHEIRTPLNAINGFTSILADESLKCEEKQEFLPIIQKNTKALTDIIDNMLDMSDLISSNEDLPVEEVDVNLLCHQMIDSLAPKGRIEYRFEDESGVCIMPVHSRYLIKVIGHLLENAVKFTEEGEIVLACRWDEEKKQLVITISDTGIGIEPEKQEWVFERFTKVDSFKPGAGVGLFLCKLIITRLGGKIFVDTHYTKGCRIVIELNKV